MSRTTRNGVDESLARERIEKRLVTLVPDVRVEALLRVGAGSRPDVVVAVIDGTRCVIKDHQGCDPLFARLLGPILARREARALERLTGLPGVPGLLRILDRRAFAMAYCDARPYKRCSLSVDEWRRFFTRMEHLVGQMHARGVAHCDLRSPDNTLVTDTGDPVIVDFVASYIRGGGWKPWSGWMFGKLSGVDNSAIEKQKRTVCPELLAGHPPPPGEEGALGRLARGFGVGVRRLSRVLFTRRRRD